MTDYEGHLFLEMHLRYRTVSPIRRVIPDGKSTFDWSRKFVNRRCVEDFADRMLVMAAGRTQILKIPGRSGAVDEKDIIDLPGVPKRKPSLGPRNRHYKRAC